MCKMKDMMELLLIRGNGMLPQIPASCFKSVFSGKKLNPRAFFEQKSILNTLQTATQFGPSPP